MKWIWKLLEARIQTVITERILMFHNALVERHQILPITKENKLQPQTMETEQ